MPHYAGGGWIRPVKRLAIYLRAGWLCAYCGADTRDPKNSTPTLEHVYRRAERGRDYNGPRNLVLACWDCNRARNVKALHEWLFSIHPDRVGTVLAELDMRLRQSITGPPVPDGSGNRESYMDQARELDDDPPGWLIDVRKRCADWFALADRHGETEGRHVEVVSGAKATLDRVGNESVTVLVEADKDRRFQITRWDCGVALEVDAAELSAGDECTASFDGRTWSVDAGSWTCPF